jgi:hypothetical protein
MVTVKRVSYARENCVGYEINPASQGRPVLNVSVGRRTTQ